MEGIGLLALGVYLGIGAFLYLFIRIIYALLTKQRLYW
jgi:hypothetical protein